MAKGDSGSQPSRLGNAVGAMNRPMTYPPVNNSMGGNNSMRFNAPPIAPSAQQIPQQPVSGSYNIPSSPVATRGLPPEILAMIQANLSNNQMGNQAAPQLSNPPISQPNEINPMGPSNIEQLINKMQQAQSAQQAQLAPGNLPPQYQGAMPDESRQAGLAPSTEMMKRFRNV